MIRKTTFPSVKKVLPGHMAVCPGAREDFISFHSFSQECGYIKVDICIVLTLQSKDL